MYTIISIIADFTHILCISNELNMPQALLFIVSAIGYGD